MATIKKIYNMGHPSLKLPFGDWPFADITAHRWNHGHVTVVIDDADQGYAGDGWGILLELTPAAAHRLGAELLAAASTRPATATATESDNA